MVLEVGVILVDLLVLEILGNWVMFLFQVSDANFFNLFCLIGICFCVV